MGVTLYPYQLDAIKRMKNGCILCGGVGSGKSLTALGYYYILNDGLWSSLDGSEDYFPMDDPPKDLYIITTARKRDTFEWEKELSKFLISPEPNVNLYSNKVVIDSWNNIKKYKDIANSFFLFDEQRLVGKGTWVKAFLEIAKNNQWILLSATPGDTWSDYIPVFIANGFYKNRTEFSNKHIIYSRYTKYPKVEKYWNEARLRHFRDKILVNMDFKRPTIVHHETIYVDYDILQYRSIQKTRWNPWKNEPIENAGEFCYCLRKCVNSHESRQIELLDIFKKHKRLIVFYNYNYELDILNGIEFGKNVRVAEWNGHKHEDIPNSLEWVYLVQYAAGCEGWNCIRTDTICFYSQNYSYKVMEQAAGRIDRLNTPYKDLHFYHLKSHSGIDLAISKALNQKKKFNESSFAHF